MNRRNFLQFAAVGLGMALDPERLLWVPGRKTIFIPPPTAFGGPVTIARFSVLNPIDTKLALLLRLDAMYGWETKPPGYSPRLKEL